jgi:hypothetical protein
VPTPGTSGTLEGRVNRGPDGTVPGSESPFITRDGRSAQPVDPATGWRRGDPAQTPAANTNHHDGQSQSGTVTPNVPARPDDWRGRAVGRHDAGNASSPAPSSGSSRDVPRRIIDGTGGAHISPDKPRDHPSGSGSGNGSNSSGSSSPPPAHSSPPPQTHSSPPPSSPPSHDSGSHESHNDGGHGKKD